MSDEGKSFVTLQTRLEQKNPVKKPVQIFLKKVLVGLKKDITFAAPFRRVEMTREKTGTKVKVH